MALGLQCQPVVFFFPCLLFSTWLSKASTVIPGLYSSVLYHDHKNYRHIHKHFILPLKIPSLFYYIKITVIKYEVK